MKNTLTLILCFVYFAKAQTKVVYPNRIPISSMQSLLLNPNASSGALGNAGVASYPDLTNWTINVAKNSFQHQKTGVGISYMPNDVLVKGMAMFNATAYHTEEFGTISLHISNYNYGTAELRDNLGVLIGNQSSNDFFVKVGFSKRLNPNISAGVALGYYRSNPFGTQLLIMPYKPSNGVNADMGFYYKGYDLNKKRFFNHGASIINIGSKLNYNDVKMFSYAPMQFRIGTSYNYLFKENDEDYRLSVNFDITKDLVPTPSGYIDKNKSSNSLGILFTSWADAPDGLKEELKEFRFHLGTEYQHKNIVARIGYQHENKYKGDRKQIGIGVGMNNIKTNYSKFCFDMAYSFPVFSSTGIVPTFRLSIGTYLGKDSPYWKTK